MASAPTVAPWLAGMLAASPETLGRAMLEADPHAWRLDRPTQSAALADALADGAVVAADFRARFPGFTAQAIARELAVPIETTDDDPMVGSLWRFAEYRQRPARIVLYRRGLALLDLAVAGALADRLFGRATPQDVFVAHELYHHAEATRSDTPIARRYRPTVFRIGGWHWRTGIAALSEIAAGAFAQSLLDLPCHPRVLDFIAADAVSAGAMGTRTADRISAIGLERPHR
jgi:ABC-type amino acid transport substrate-binding protein